MGDYQALLAYVGVALVVFVGGIIWQRYREGIKRRFNINEYRFQGKDHKAKGVSA